VNIPPAIPTLLVSAKFQIQPHHLIIFGIREGQGDVNDSPNSEKASGRGESLNTPVKFQIQPDHLVILRIQEDQGDLNDSQTAGNPAEK
jgi:hypothetical protein